jgi:hypothetical protein
MENRPDRRSRSSILFFIDGEWLGERPFFLAAASGEFVRRKALAQWSLLWTAVSRKALASGLIFQAPARRERVRLTMT